MTLAKSRRTQHKLSGWLALIKVAIVTVTIVVVVVVVLRISGLMTELSSRVVATIGHPAHIAKHSRAAQVEVQRAVHVVVVLVVVVVVVVVGGSRRVYAEAGCIVSIYVRVLLLLLSVPLDSQLERLRLETCDHWTVGTCVSFGSS